MENIKRIQIGPTEGAKWIPTQDNVKHINVDLTPKKERRDGRCEDPDEDTEAEPEEKVPRKRVVTNMSEWTFTEAELSPENQLEYIQQIYNDANKKVVHFSANFPNANSVVWEFGDGFTAPTPKARHIYAKPGIYEIKVKIQDACGQRILKRKVTV